MQRFLFTAFTCMFFLSSAFAQTPSGTNNQSGILEKNNSPLPGPLLYRYQMMDMDSGKVGIGTDTPVELLDVNGGLKIGTTTGTHDGTIRWTGTDFEGRKAGSWVSLTGGIGVTGSTGQTLYHNGTNWTATSNLYHNGVKAGIGTTSPHAQLHLMPGSGVIPFKIGGGITGNTSTDQGFYNGEQPEIDASGHWQSFLVTISGYLAYRPAFASGAPMTVRLYSGTGTGGTLLETLSNVNGQNANFIDFSTLVTAGQTYTIAFSDGPPGNNQWSHSSGGGYANGQSDLGGDFFVDTKISLISPVVLVDENGNLGVGTSSPAAKLDVNGSLRVQNGSQGAGKVLTSDANGLATWQGSQWATFSNHIYANNSGNVGIGTGIPQDKLHILNGGIRIGNTADAKNYILAYDATDDYFYIDEFGTGRHFTIRNGGNVGIGTTAPNHLLEVNGSLKASTVQVSTNGTTLSVLREGETTIGANAIGGVKVVSVSFGVTLAAAPHINATVITENFTDVFIANVRNVTTTGFEVLVYRLDIQGGLWGQNLKLNWVAVK